MQTILIINAISAATAGAVVGPLAARWLRARQRGTVRLLTARRTARRV